VMVGPLDSRILPGVSSKSTNFINWLARSKHPIRPHGMVRQCNLKRMDSHKTRQSVVSPSGTGKETEDCTNLALRPGSGSRCAGGGRGGGVAGRVAVSCRRLVC
jgi:hypothetical protein